MPAVTVAFGSTGTTAPELASTKYVPDGSTPPPLGSTLATAPVARWPKFLKTYHAPNSVTAVAPAQAIDEARDIHGFTVAFGKAPALPAW